MRIGRGFLLLALLALGGCHTARRAAVTSFRVIDAPANYVRRHLDESDQTTTTTTTTSSDVVTPGRPIEPPPPATTQRRTTARSTAQPPPPRTTVTETAPRTSAPPSRTTAAQAPQYPTAKPVPGKPGFVYSPYDPNGGYVDVTGYAAGSKAKDPYSQKIFIVP